MEVASFRVVSERMERRKVSSDMLESPARVER